MMNGVTGVSPPQGPVLDPLIIYGHDSRDSLLPIMVAVENGKPEGGMLLFTEPVASPSGKLGLPMHGYYDYATASAWLIAVGCMRASFDSWVELLYKNKGAAVVEEARAKLFDQQIICNVLTAGRGVGGRSCGAGMILSLACMVFQCRFRRDTVITGELTASGCVSSVGSAPEKVDLAAKHGKTRMILPASCKAAIVTDRAKRKKRKGGGTTRSGDAVELIGVKDIWETLDEYLVIDPPGECTISFTL